MIRSLAALRPDSPRWAGAASDDVDEDHYPLRRARGVVDRRGAPRVLIAGAACFAIAYAWFAAGPDHVLRLLPAFILAGIGIGCAETAEHAAVASLSPTQLRGSAFGLLAAIQAAGNLAASTTAGILWTAVSPTAAFVFLGVAITIAVVLIAVSTSHLAPAHR